MNVTVEALSSVKKKLTFELPVDRVNSEFDKVYRGVSRRASVPGFRKGKVPRHVLEKQFADLILDEVLKNLVNDTCFPALQEHGVLPVGPPEIESDPVRRGEPFVYSATVEVYPEIELKVYRGLALKKEKYVHDEAVVNERLSRLRESMAQLKPVNEERAVAAGDFVTIDFTGYLDGVAFPNGAAEDFQLEIGSKSFIPGFEDQLIGLKAGESKRIDVTFPENYGNSDLAGRNAEFAVTVKDIKVREIPELDDELAREAGEFETLDHLRKRIAEVVEQQENERINTDLKNALCAALIDQNPCEVPDTLVERQLAHMLESMKERLARQQMSLGMVGLDEGSFASHYRETAVNQVKTMFLLNAVARAERIEVSDADMEEKYRTIAQEVGQDVEIVRGVYERNREAKDNLKAQLQEDKVIDYLIANADIAELKRDDLKH